MMRLARGFCALGMWRTYAHILRAVSLNTPRRVSRTVLVEL